MSEHHPPQHSPTKRKGGGMMSSVTVRRIAVALLLLSTILFTLHRSLGILAGFQLVPLEHSQGLRVHAQDDSRVLQGSQANRIDSVDITNAKGTLVPMIASYNSAQEPISFEEILGLPKDKNGNLITKAPRNKQEQLANKRRQSEIALQKRNHKENSNRTAIVWVCRYLDECGAARVKQLLQTVGAAPANATNTIHDNGRDVWILYNHKSIKAGSKEFKLSAKLIGELKQYARAQLGIRLRGAQQSSKSLAFDGPRSGSGKSSFLKFVVHAQYGHAWHIEDDVWYTGKWKTIFDTPYNPDRGYDVVATGGPVPSDWYHFARSKCHIKLPAVAEFNQKRMFLAADCSDIQQQLTRWGFLRVSLRFADTLLELAKGDAVVGHHEAVVASMCHAYHYNCSYDELTPHIGQMVTGGWGDWKNATKQTLANHNNVEPNKVYHPVKCAAYSKDSKSLTQLLSSY